MAKSKVKKGFLYYILMFLFLVLGVLCIFATILIFNPGKDVYGINLRYVSIHNAKEFYNLTNEEKQISDTNFDTVEFNAGNTNFNITYDGNETFTKVYFQPYVTALSKSENIKFDISITESSNKLLISVTEPELWLTFANSATINIVFPLNKKLDNVAFNVNTTSGSVKFGDESSTMQYAIKDLNIKTETGSISIYKNLAVASQNIKIETKSGLIHASSNTTGTLDIENTKGIIRIGDLQGSLKLTNYDRLEADCNYIAQDVYVKSTNGYIKIKKLGQNSTNGNFTTTENTDNTNIVIKEMTGNASIVTNTGYVSIDNLGGQALIETSSGNITIKQATNNVDINTISGAVNITQLSIDARTTINTEKGQITANFEEIGNVTLSTENSNININVTTGKPFKIVYDSGKGIETSWATAELSKNGTILVSGADDSSKSKITALAPKGKIKLYEGFVFKTEEN